MAEYLMRGPGDIDQVFTYLDRTMLGHATSCEAVGTYGAAFENGRIILRVYEKYYMRTSSRASLTVMLISRDGTVDVKIISSGGSAGGMSAIAKFSWGAEENFIGVALNALQQIGFTQV